MNVGSFGNLSPLVLGTITSLVSGFNPFWKNTSQNGNLPQIGVKIIKWNHHPEWCQVTGGWTAIILLLLVNPNAWNDFSSFPWTNRPTNGYEENLRDEKENWFPQKQAKPTTQPIQSTHVPQAPPPCTMPIDAAQCDYASNAVAWEVRSDIRGKCHQRHRSCICCLSVYPIWFYNSDGIHGKSWKDIPVCLAIYLPLFLSVWIYISLTPSKSILIYMSMAASVSVYLSSERSKCS